MTGTIPRQSLVVRILKWALMGIGIVVLLCIAGLVWFGYELNKGLETKFDPKLYPEILQTKITNGATGYAFFPATIEPDSEKVGFFYVPGFLQGADILSLRLKLQPRNISIILSNLLASGRSEVTNIQEMPFDSQCFPSFTLDKKHQPSPTALPNDFRVFLFQSDIAAIKTNWNHNFLAFTAISASRNEVLYYADAW